jgi:hypothetical protein
MSKSYKMRRKLVDINRTKYCCVPNEGIWAKTDKVDVEIFEDKIVILPVK